MPRTTDAPGGPESRTPWWLDEMIDRANSGRGRYEVGVPATVLEDWIANIRPALAALAAARPVVAAVEASLGPCWEALCRCVDEFEPGDTGACEERRQDLYGAVGRVLDALATREDDEEAG